MLGYIKQAENFSFDVIDSNSFEEMTIPINEQMTVHGDLILEGNMLADGNLIIEA